MFLRKKRNRKKEIDNLEVQTRRKEKVKKEKINIKWVLSIIFIAFLISILFSFVSEVSLPNVNIYVGIIIILFFIMIGILFDIIGVAVTTADQKVFHSMNSRKVKGAKTAVLFKKHAEKVSSFCCDVVGDICGIISGTAASYIAISISKSLDVQTLLISLLTTAVTASLTIGGKAIGKSFAINKSNIILYEFAKFTACFYKER